MGFRLLPVAGDSPHTALGTRAAHAVELSTSHRALVETCAELRALASVDEDGVFRLPYWAVLQLCLLLVCSG